MMKTTPSGARRMVRIPRGTARKLRREAWATIRVRTERFEERTLWDETSGMPIRHKVKIEGWKPSFAEFTRRQQGGNHEQA